MSQIRFAVPGVERMPTAPLLEDVPQAKAIEVGIARDGAGGENLIDADSERHVVALSFRGGPTLYVNPRDVAALVAPPGSMAATRGAADSADAGVVHIGASLPGAASRGLVGQVLKGFGLFDFGSPQVAAKLATPLIAKAIEEQVNPGVWKLAAGTLPVKAALSEPMEAAKTPVDAPLLVFIHGTASCTGGGYQALWARDNDALRQALFDRYGGRVFALEHKTLTESPIDNALDLASRLPKGVRLHIVTHSRGGLIADLLSRSQAWLEGPDGRLLPAPAFDDDDLAYLKDDAQYAGMADKLQELSLLLKQREIVVERLVRVASPSRGTILASRRLDLYLSTLSWLIGRGAEAAAAAALVPVAGVLGAAQALAKLAAAIAHDRTDAKKLPGIEAMMPERRLVAMLNRRDVRVGGDLRVVAGDIEAGDNGMLHWLKVKLTDAYYWEDHDLVVNTSSMDKGPRRLAGRAWKLVTRGALVDHFSYFKADHTARAVDSALQDPVPADFVPVDPPPAAPAVAAVGRARGARDAAAAAAQPAVIVLPGIMGSHLVVGGKRVWLQLPRLVRGGFGKLAYQAEGKDGVTAGGPMGRYYDRVMNVLANSHEVIPFAYDWRLPIETSAEALAVMVGKAIDARRTSGQPVRVLAHSMGGLVLRAMQWVDTGTWNRMMTVNGARVVMLGVPNQGSMAPATVLTGRDAFANLLEGADLRHGRKEFLAIAAGFPGLLQMLACHDDPAQDWYASASWQSLLDIDLHHAASGDIDDFGRPVACSDWTVPPRDVLEGARVFQAKLAKQDLSRHEKVICLVHGQARETPVRAELVDGRFEFQSVAEGDGRVTWAAGRIPGAACAEYLVDAAHGDLPNVEDAFSGYAELLMHGSTTQLASLPAAASGASRGAPAAAGRAAAPPTRGRYGFAVPRFPGSDEELADAAVGAWPRARQGRRVVPPIEVEVLHANLRYVEEAILVGHQEGTGLYSAERFVNGVFRDRLRHANELGAYPGPLGTSQIFLPPPDPSAGQVKVRPEKVLVVGLGPVGELTPRTLRSTVTTALLNFAQDSTRHRAPASEPVELSIASLLIGTGASNISTEDSVQAILQAAQDANVRLEQSRVQPSVRYARLRLVDYYENLAIDALRAALALAASRANRADAATSMRPPLKVLPQLKGAGPAFRHLRPRPDGGGWPQFVHISRNEAGEIAFGLTTDRARTPVLRQPTQRELIARLVREGEGSTQSNDVVGQLLFELAVPLDLKERLGEARSLVLDLDPAAAALPWEMVTRKVEEQKEYPALMSPVVRKLRLEDYRATPRDARGERALVIGAPLAPSMPDLPGAIEEAEGVASVMRTSLGEKAVELLLQPPMLDVFAAVLNHEWRIMHFAGHGTYQRAVPEQGKPAVSGMVLSDGVLLSPLEIGQMRTVPELVFVNCCFLGKIEPAAAAFHGPGRPPLQERGLFAANLAEQLIRNGVRCVVAAGWAVDDAAARDFGAEFYRVLLGGGTFGEAVLSARQAARAHAGSNTWAAYQCYGELEWRYRRDRAAGAGAGAAAADGAADIVAPSQLVEELEDLWVRADGADAKSASTAALLARLADLERRYGAVWGERGAVAQAFGRAALALGRDADALRWLRQAVNAGDAQAALEALEDWVNQEARQAKCAADVQGAIDQLVTFITIAPTGERYALLGGAYKRLTRFARAGRARREALAGMRRAYEKALAAIPDARRHERFYAAQNLLAAGVADRLAGASTPGLDALRAACARSREHIAVANDVQPDFWSHVAEIDVDLYECLAEDRLSEAKESLERRYRTLAERAGNRNEWGSVRSQLAWLGDSARDSEVKVALAQLAEVIDKLRP